MVSVIYCTKESNEEHSKHIHKMFGHPKVEVIEYVNKGEGLTKFYSKGLKEAKYDIVVFLHDDIIIETKQVASKLVKLYENNPEYGVLGVAGSKYMAESGRWWENSKKMYGRVAHTHQGKTWLSAYSDDLGNNVEEVVNVDGVFFSVHKKRLKVDFDLKVKGFHFYDVDFSFRCHLSGVKVGVHTNIRVNHMSIGETNDEWEQNRIEFAEKFKDKLPINLKRVISDNHSLKVLIATKDANDVLDLALKFKSNKHNVTICSVPNLVTEKILNTNNIHFSAINEPPGYKIGDGSWLLKTNEGDVTSEVNKLYRVKIYDYDVLCVNDNVEIENYIKQFYPQTPTINVSNDESTDDIINLCKTVLE